MAAGNGVSGSSLKKRQRNAKSSSTIMDQLLGDARSYSFTQAIRIIGIDNVVFKTRMSMSPSINIVDSIRPIEGSYSEDTGSAKFIVSVNKFTILGEDGPMPANYSDMVLQMPPQERASVIEFLDIFSDRFLRLHFQIKKKFRIHDTPPYKSLYFKALTAIAGSDTTVDGKNINSNNYSRKSLFSHASLLSTQPKSLSALEVFLQEVYGFDIKIQPFIGRWRNFEKEQSFILGKSMLGREKFLGEKAWIQGDSIEVTIGPMSSIEFKDFISTGMDKDFDENIRKMLPFNISHRVKYVIDNDAKGVMGEKYLGYDLFLNGN